MKTSPVSAQDLQRSVIAVPPLARHDDLSLNEAANKALLGHLEAGGVRNVMYGGNANFYNVAVSEYARIVDMLAGLCLLYTSPSPRDVEESRMPSSA